MENYTRDVKKREMQWLNTEDYFERTNLTKNQMFIWMEQKMYPDTSLYNMASTFAFSGQIDVEHFKHAFQELINCNDALRTVILEIDIIPMQKVLSPFVYELEFIDLSMQEQPEQEARTRLKQRCLHRFHLEQLMFDSVLIKCSESSFIWYFCQHHVIGDAWSNILVYRRQVKLYESSLQGTLHLESHSYPQFQEYIALEKAYRNSPQYLRDQIYWQQ